MWVSWSKYQGFTQWKAYAYDPSKEVNPSESLGNPCADYFTEADDPAVGEAKEDYFQTFDEAKRLLPDKIEGIQAYGRSLVLDHLYDDHGNEGSAYKTAVLNDVDGTEIAKCQRTGADGESRTCSPDPQFTYETYLQVKCEWLTEE